MESTGKPTLADKLKALGVKKGTTHLAPLQADSHSIESVVAGSFFSTPRGDVFVAEQAFPRNHRHGNFAILSPTKPSLISQWANDEKISTLPISKFAFIDTETTGLAVAPGTYVIMVTVGRFMGDQFVLKQYFMRDPAEEPAFLEGLAKFLAPCQAMVTFNGKLFDAPLLRVRYQLNDLPSPLDGYAHLDLLPLARRLWHDRLESRALKYLEEHVLGLTRSSEEVPGYMIPGFYFDYLHTSDAGPLAGAFYHNAMDVLAMAALFAHMNEMMENPFDGKVQHGLDFIALGKLFEDLGHIEEAARLYERGLEAEMDESDFSVAVRRLSALQKKRGDYEEAIRLWKKAAKAGHIYAHIELAKYHEHKLRDVKAALKWTKSASREVERANLPVYECKHWLDEIAHRQARLERKDSI